MCFLALAEFPFANGTEVQRNWPLSATVDSVADSGAGESLLKFSLLELLALEWVP